MKERLLLIDGYNLAFRSFHAVPQSLETSNNIPVNALYGFLRTFLASLEELAPDYVLVCLDAPAKTFRSMADDRYKAQRKETPESLRVQLKLLSEQLLPGLNIPFIMREGYEADDLIAGCCRKFSSELEIVILSNDRDLFQLLIQDKISIILPDRKKNTHPYTEEDFIKEYGIQPSQFVLYKALTGDTSDNIQGISGIGPKTAIRLIQEYTSLESILESKSKWADILQEQKDTILHNIALVRLLEQVSIDKDKEDLSFKNVSAEAMVQIAKTFEFHSLLKAYQKQTQPRGANLQPGILNIENLNEGDIKALLELSGWTFCYLEEKGHIQAYHPAKGLIEGRVDDNLPSQEENALYQDILNPLEQMKALFLSSKQVKTYDAKKLMHILRIEADHPLPSIDDLQIMFYLLHPNLKQYSMVEFLLRYGEDHQHVSAKSIDDSYALLKNEIERLNLAWVYEELEKPLIIVLYAMEKHGIKIAVPELKKLKTQLNHDIEQLATEIHAYAEDAFNIASPKQLSFVLFEKLRLPPVKKTKTGYSTNAEVLDMLEPMHPIIPKIKKYREMTKLLSTYVEVFLKKINNNGVLHTTFLQAGPSTGRISSMDPNLQNLPSAMDNDLSLKSIFIPREKDKVFVSAGYSQIDLRVLAHFSEDPILMEAFHQEKDIHAQTARTIFNLNENDEVNEKMRKSAKTINFGIIYGMCSFGLSNALKIGESEAQEMIHKYFASFPRIKDFKKKVIEQAQKDGFVTTLTKRRRSVPEINSSNRQIQQLGERLAFNTIIQGGSADIIKTAMIRMHAELLSFEQTFLLLQIHDELIWECPASEIDLLKGLALKEMEHAFSLKVPLKVHIKKGNNLASLILYHG